MSNASHQGLQPSGMTPWYVVTCRKLRDPASLGSKSDQTAHMNLIALSWPQRYSLETR